MGSNKRRARDRRPARRAPSREPRKRILLVCEGKVTEPFYFKDYERHTRNASVVVEIADQHGVPRTLVEVAKDLRKKAAQNARQQGDSFLEYDEVWCVFDRDAHPNFNDACQMARDNKIELAVSNPCFELWLLLHFRESPGMQDRHRIQNMMKNFIPDYGKCCEFSKFVDGIDNAINRARLLDRDAKQMSEPGRNPSTGVYRLVNSISER